MHPGCQVVAGLGLVLDIYAGRQVAAGLGLGYLRWASSRAEDPGCQVMAGSGTHFLTLIGEK